MTMTMMPLTPWTENEDEEAAVCEAALNVDCKVGHLENWNRHE